MPESTFDLNQTHELYCELEPVRRRARDLTGGSIPVKAAREKYLFRTQNESDAQYELRLKRAVYDNWPRVVLEMRQALLWNRMPTRNLPSPIAEFEKDVDGRGTHADAFFQSVSESADIDGISWVLVDAPRGSGVPEAEGRVLTRFEEAALGLRPRFVHLLAADVLDWDWGSDGQLNYVVIRQDTVVRPGPGLRPDRILRRLVWTRESWTLYEGEEERAGQIVTGYRATPGHLERANAGAPNLGATDSLVWVMKEEGTNDLGVIPIVPFYGIFATDGLGWPVVVDILDHAISIYNKFSDRDVTEFLTNNPIPYVIAPDNPGSLKVNQGNGIYLKSGGALGGGSSPTVALGYLEPSGNALTASRESERDLISRIFLIALKQARKATAQVQSAESIRGEGRVFAASLSATAGRLEDAELLCWGYALGWKGEVDLANNEAVKALMPSKTVEYSRDFDDELLEGTLLNALAGATRDGLISKRTFLSILKQGEVIPDSVDVDDELRQIEDDAFAAVGSMPGFGRLGGGAAPPDEGAAA